jgi:cell division septal protein FtsQ
VSPRSTKSRRGLPPAASGVAAPADRRFRRPDIRPGTRARLGQLAWRIGRLIAVLGITVAAATWAARALLDSSLLNVKHIVVHGNARLSAAAVESLLDGIHSERILTIDFEAYRKRVLDSPWVADVSMRRILPSTVELRLVERVPMAVARLGPQLYLVDRMGVIIDEFGPQYRDFDLPIVDGLVRTVGRGAPVADTARAQLTGRFLDALDTRPDFRGQISQVDVSNAHDLVAILDGDPAALHLGETQFVERLSTYFEISQTLHDQFSSVEYVDLRFDERVYVRPHGRAQTAALKK